MSFLLKLTAYAGWLIILVFVVIAILAITGSFDHPWSDPPV